MNLFSFLRNPQPWTALVPLGQSEKSAWDLRDARRDEPEGSPAYRTDEDES